MDVKYVSKDVNWSSQHRSPIATTATLNEMALHCQSSGADINCQCKTEPASHTLNVGCFITLVNAASLSGEEPSAFNIVKRLNNFSLCAGETGVLGKL